MTSFMLINLDNPKLITIDKCDIMSNIVSLAIFCEKLF